MIDDDFKNLKRFIKKIYLNNNIFYYFIYIIYKIKIYF